MKGTSDGLRFRTWQRKRGTLVRAEDTQQREVMCIDNNLIFRIYIIVRKHYHTHFELIHAFYIWFWNNVE